MKRVRADVDRFWVVFVLLLRFFKRTLFRYGVLRDRAVRWAIMGLAVAWMAFSCGVVWFLLRSLGPDSDLWPLVLDLTWVSTIPWVIAVFLIVKLLFSKADGALRIAGDLPVTGMVRGLAMKACEMSVVLVAVLLSMLAVSVALIASSGFGALDLICLHLVLPALLLYTLLELAWDMVGRVMGAVGLPQFASLVAMCGMTAVLVRYVTLVLPLVTTVQERWRRPDGDILWATAIADVARRSGGLAAAGAALLLLVAIILADSIVAPPRYSRQADYLPFHGPFAGRADIAMFAAYVLRSQDTFLETILATALTIMLCVQGGTGIATMPVCLVTFTGMSQFANGIVPAWSRYRRSPSYTYLCMVCAQLIVYTPIWLVLTLLTLPWGWSGLAGCGYSYLGIVAGTIICTMLGILFPMTKRNPLTAIAGLAFLIFAGILLLFAIGLLNLSGPPLAVVLATLLAAAILYSILGIHAYQRSIRYEHR